ncbi:hypothetical protein WJX75_000972 [Coccomyxa subellipsoidea]|uniref:Pyruvate dehydrogenase E1 component subunit beta n=1 Tax=Coccomyxa subellipsoidea TaxID=248742 RepID=A0ABR2YWZ6_9CHLO
MQALRQLGLGRSLLGRKVDSFALQCARTFASGEQTITIRDALNSALDEEMARDGDVFILGEEVGEYQGAYKITRGLLQKYGQERVRDTPITEAGFTGIATGAAMAGLKPHSQCFAAWYSSVPGLKVLAPYDAEDSRGLLKAAIRDPDPVVFLENEILYGESFPVTDEILSHDFVSPIGKCKVMREGTDVTLVAFGKLVGYNLKVAEELEKEGISCEVINLRTLKPIDRETIVASVRKTHRIVSTEEGWPQCGIGAEIMAIATEECFDDLDAAPERVTGAEVPMPYAANLEAAALPQIADIIKVVKRVVGK